MNKNSRKRLIISAYFTFRLTNVNKGVIAKNVNKNSRKRLIISAYFTFRLTNVNKELTFTRASAT
ncbi:MAG: hypothetical protein WC765_10375, partial [Phycisphaerae bacterium]